MPIYVIPQFPLTCNVWSWPAVDNFPTPPSGAPRVVACPCQLTYGKRVNVGSTGGTDFAGVLLQGISLLLPAKTDIRGPQDTVGVDAVEVPAGSGRFYQVIFVDDIAKGFANEHRTATLVAGDGMWAAPYP